MSLKEIICHLLLFIIILIKYFDNKKKLELEDCEK